MKVSPILSGLGAGLVLALLLAPATGTALGQLGKVRGERATWVARAAAPRGEIRALAPGLAFAVADEAAGRAAIMARLQRLAKAGGVLVEESSAVAAPAGLAALRIRVSGAEKAVISLADALERERPAIRLRRWQVQPIEGGVRLTGEAVAAWR